MRRVDAPPGLRPGWGTIRNSATVSIATYAPANVVKLVPVDAFAGRTLTESDASSS